ncbi:MAG TPA: hypothetical protein VFQ38_02205 [Longimicrobiales bacterium]|nr:hypothetical protein [Longimicrobiales bacterium]
MPRRLRGTRRHVAGDRVADYLEAWSRFRDTAVGLGARAWLFRSGDVAGRFLEFLEWDAAGADPGSDPRVRSARAALEDFGDGEEELWDEATWS